MIRYGVDLGGSKIEIIALENDGTTLLRERMPTPAGDYPETIAGIARLVNDAEHSTGRQGSVGVATPGAISPATGMIKNANSTCLNGQPLQEDLEQVLQRSVRISNDANCFALSESGDGAAVDARAVFGVIIGTGTGGALVINGEIVEGCNRIGGEWGHNPLPWPQAEELPGAPCYCGLNGCIETWLSGPGLSVDHQLHTGENLAAVQIAERAADGTSSADKTIKRYEERMARALASVINVVDPDVIVLGGGLSNITRLYENVPKLWGDYVFSDVVNTRLLAPQHGDSSGVRGAAWLWPPQ